MSEPTPPRRIGVVPFDRDLLRDHLERASMQFETDNDGDFIIRFTPNEEFGYQLIVLLMAQGTNGEVLAMRCVSNIRVGEAAIPATIAACNNWSMNAMMPTPFVVGEQVTDESGAEGVAGAVVLQSHFPLSAGVTQPMVDEFVSSFFGACFGFWNWFSQEAVPTIQASIDGNGDGGESEAEPENEYDPNAN